MAEAEPIDPKLFRSALGSFATGVTIVTARDPAGTDVGVTANSFNSVSLDPPMVLWSLAKSSGNLEAFRDAPGFAVHILSVEQEALSNLFARRGVDRFAGLDLARGHGDAPLIGGCAARFECRTAFQHDGGDHVIFIGEVVRFEHSSLLPLVFHGGRYGYVVRQETSVEAPADPPEGSFRADLLGYLLGRAYEQIFLPIRRELEVRGIPEAEYLALSVLGTAGHRTVDDLRAIVGFTGVKVTERLVATIVARGYVRAEEGAPGPPRLALTPAGRRLVLELIAVAEAAERQAEEGLDRSETYLLRQLLKRVIRNTDPGVPPLWGTGG
jgi:3-hydroxy-9,10-secoandrosta-1,3,5(10)-triene-9,17-dione monooxygenase reductase component